MHYTPQQLQHLLEANRILSSTLNLSELLRQILRLATDVVDAETSSLLLYDEAKDELWFDLALGEQETQLKQIRLKMGEGIAGAAAHTRATQIVNDVQTDRRWAKTVDGRTQFQTRSVLAVPLLYQGQLRGVVEAINKRGGGFTADDAELLEAFAAQAALSIENARTFERLQEEKEKIQAIFSQMSDGAVAVDRMGAKLLANEAAARFLGADAAARTTFPEMMAGFALQPPAPELLAGTAAAVPFTATRSTGKKLCFGGTASRIVDAAGGVIGFMFVFRDITDELKEKAVTRNFLSLISHKLKTPLVAITGYGPMLLEGGNLDDFQKKAITSMHRQGLHLAGLVDKLLGFTLIDGDSIELTLLHEKWQTVVEKAVAALQTYIREKGAAVTVAASVQALPPVRMDREKIGTAVVNLIENAIKFNPGRPTVEIRGRSGDGYIGIEVADNGPGIPPEEREKIFRKFYQIEESFTGQVEGAGLGLALVKRVAEAHGGFAGVESELGRGSRFILMLPGEGYHENVS
jgi:signal transduction histidine kinase